jgi:hypothetical protein
VSKGGLPDCLTTREIEVEFGNFGRSLPHLLGATSTSKSTKAHNAEAFLTHRRGPALSSFPEIRAPRRRAKNALHYGKSLAGGRRSPLSLAKIRSAGM